MSKVVYEGWMVRYGRTKIGRSYIHMRYFVLEPRLLAYYKRKPQDNQVFLFHFSLLSLSVLQWRYAVNLVTGTVAGLSECWIQRHCT